MTNENLPTAYSNTIHSPLVLVIDDSVFMRNSMRSILEGIGCRVICAKDGLEGVNMFLQFKPPFVLCDAIMPIMDGLTACATMRKMDCGKNALIYMITTETDRKLVENAFEVGFDDYWVKPIVSNVFIPRMKKIIQEYLTVITTEKVTANTTEVYSELEEARKLQLSFMPKPLENQYLQIRNIYSPYDQVSGDFIDYWWNESEQTLHGYVLDVTGHSIASAMQVFTIKTLFNQFFQCGKSCLLPNRILQFVNRLMFDGQKRKYMATALVFTLDVKEKMLHYSAAGISPIFIKSTDTYEQVKTRGHPMGYKKDNEYKLEHVSIKGATEVIFASDGFSEMFNSGKKITAKHDDVAAILIKIKQQEDFR